MKKLAIKSLLSRTGGALGSFAIAADRGFRRRRPKQSSKHLKVTEISVGEIGDEFQALWIDKVSEQTRLFTDRSVAAIRWHCEIPGDRGTTRVLRCSKNARLVGYAIVRHEPPDKNGLRKSVIVDVLVRDDEPTVVEALLAAAYSHAGSAGSDILEVMGFPESIRSVFMQSRPYQRRYPACPYYYKAANPEFHKALSDPSAWYACPFDGDATLIRPSFSSTFPPPITSGVRAEDSRSSIAIAVAERERTEVF